MKTEKMIQIRYGYIRRLKYFFPIWHSKPQDPEPDLDVDPDIKHFGNSGSGSVRYKINSDQVCSPVLKIA